MLRRQREAAAGRGARPRARGVRPGAGGRSDGPPGPGDVELVVRVAHADPAALAVLYERHSAAACRLARGMLRFPSPAEEAVVDAFLDLWRDAARYDGATGSVQAWLLGLVRRRCIERLRRLDDRTRRQIVGDGLPGRPAGDDDVHPAAAGRDDGARARGALMGLPVDERRVVELAYFGGLTQAEIAEHLDVPLATVQARVRRGVAGLKAELPARGPDP